jgi:hypothetical protein
MDMARVGGAVLEAPIWEEVSAERPCACCGASVGCSILADGEFLRCLSEVSQWPVSGGGWLHRRAEGGPVAIRAG